jgi:hypothetical protein
LFWKNKSENDIIIELDSDDRRDGVRIHPADTIILTHNNQTFTLLDISSTGLSFNTLSSEQYHRGDQLNISLLPPQYNKTRPTCTAPIICTIEIILIKNNHYHCHIKTISPDGQHSLDHFILEEQKRQIHKQSR